MCDIKKEPSLDKANLFPLTSVKNEPSIIKKEFGFLEAGSTSTDWWWKHESNYKASDFPITNVKAEVIDDAIFSEDEGSAGAGLSSYAVAVTKQELDIGPTELQQPNVHFMLQPCKAEPDYHIPLPIVKDTPQGHKLLLLEEKEFTRQPHNDLLLRDSPGNLPQGICGSMSQHIQRVTIVAQFAHTDAAKDINRHVEFLAPSSRVRARIMPQDATHCDNIHLATSNAQGDNPCNEVHFEKFVCEYCPKVFSWKSNLLSHMQVHEHVFQKITKLSAQKIGDTNSTHECDFCHKLFFRKSKFMFHMLVHKCVKLHECKSCGKRFSISSDLTKHMRVHAGEKLFQCKYCGKKFKFYSLYTVHMKVHTGHKPFECKSCEKTFTQNGHLSAHMTVHTGEKPFECKSCGKRFSRNGHLTEHMRVHTGEKPFMCNSCGKRIARKADLIKHKRLHTRQKSF